MKSPTYIFSFTHIWTNLLILFFSFASFNRTSKSFSSLYCERDASSLYMTVVNSTGIHKIESHSKMRSMENTESNALPPYMMRSVATRQFEYNTKYKMFLVSMHCICIYNLDDIDIHFS